jgi:hypothetical protein
VFDPALTREEAGNVLLRLRVGDRQVFAFPLDALLHVFALFFPLSAVVVCFCADVIFFFCCC